MFVELHETNEQQMPAARSIKELWEELEKLLKEAEEVASLTKPPLPNYAYQIFPQLCFRPTQASKPFGYQFQPWFDLQALQAQWRRTERVAGQLEGYINIGQLLRTSDERSWRYGKPIGIKLDPDGDEAKDAALAMAYAYLGVPVAPSVDLRIPRAYSLREAREVMLDNVRDFVASCTTFPIISDLAEDRYDGLTFLVVCPRFSNYHYNADGTRTTKLQCKQLEEGESSNMVDDSGSVDSEGSISPHSEDHGGHGGCAAYRHLLFSSCERIA